MSNLREVDLHPSDAITSVQFSLQGTRLAVGCWDGTLYVYQRVDSDEGHWYTPWKQINMASPVLDCAWGQDEDTVFCVGCDKTVSRYNLAQPGEMVVMSEHSEGSNKIAYDSARHLLLSTSWNGTLHVHETLSNKWIRARLPAKPLSLSLTGERAAIVMANRKVAIYDLSALAGLVAQNEQDMGDATQFTEIQPWQERESSLKFQARAVSCMPDGTGFATASIEGRVSVDWFDPERQADSYAFKCHRQSETTQDEEGDEVEVDVIFPVNALAFHPVHHTFATGGGDGVVALWDASTKRRIRQYKELGASVAALDFSPDGEWMAIGISAGFETGSPETGLDGSQTKVLLRKLGEHEAKGKTKRAK